MNIDNACIGCDLEYAVMDSTGNIIPAGALDTPGTKGRPEFLMNGGIEIDCCALEITPRQAFSEDGFAHNILSLLTEVKNKYTDYKFLTKPSHNFDEEMLANVRHANVMGCSPDYNAWNNKVNPCPKPEKGLRSFGGHVHIEYGTVTTIRACDLTLGMWSVMNDGDLERKKIYGKAGAFRKKQYGVEYRTMSNFWCDDEAKIRQVFKLARKALSFNAKQVTQVIAQFGGSKGIQRIINENDTRAAEQVYKMAVGM